MLNFKLANWVLNCHNYSSKSGKGTWALVFSQYPSDELLSPASTGWLCCMRSKGVGSWMSGMSSVSWLPYLVAMPCVLQHIPKVFSKAFQGWLFAVRGHVYVAVVVQVLGGESHFPGKGCNEHGCFLCRWGALQSGVHEIQLVTGEHFICLLVCIFDCPLWGLITTPVFRHRIVGWGKGCKITAYAPCMLTQILPLVADSDK